MTAPSWPEVVAAVPHDRGCASNKPYACREKWRDGELISSDTNGPCNCTRDARIGAGIAAARESDTKYHDGGWGHDDCSVCEREEADARDTAAVAAFRGASKPKEG